jgi:hypothetical protein
MVISMAKPRTIIAASAMALPVAYIVKKHVEWEKSPNAKRRMLIHQLTFWSSVVIALRLLHRTFRHYRERSPLLKAGRLFLASGMLIAGFEGGERLARYLVPKRPKQPIRPLSLPASNPNRYAPAYLLSSSGNPVRQSLPFQNQFPEVPPRNPASLPVPLLPGPPVARQSGFPLQG